MLTTIARPSAQEALRLRLRVRHLIQAFGLPGRLDAASLAETRQLLRAGAGLPTRHPEEVCCLLQEVADPARYLRLANLPLLTDSMYVTKRALMQGARIIQDLLLEIEAATAAVA